MGVSISMQIARGTFLLVSFVVLAAPAFGQIGRVLDAHGGLGKWRAAAGVEYDLTWKSVKGDRHDHQLFNLQDRSGLITSEKHTVGSEHGEVWIKPGLDAIGGTPPRFYIGTPFYFFGMPFVFADPGSKQESLGKKIFRGKEYDALKITFAKGTGDTPDDYYIAYTDPASNQLKLTVYIVTYPSVRKDKPIDQLDRHAIVFDEWQAVDGLVVPKKAQFYKWSGIDLEGDALGVLEYSSVRFLKEPPDEAKFRKPADAVIAPM